jgi:hypothetical protein
MPIPAGFDNTVRVVSGSPVGATEINAELATQNAAGYLMTSLEFHNAETCLLLFVKSDPIYGYAIDQKVNLVDPDQTSIDADKTTEIALGYWPTGIFVNPSGDLFVGYQLLDSPPL